MFLEEQRIAFNEGKIKKNLFKWFKNDIEVYLSITLYQDKELLYGLLQQIKIKDSKQITPQSFVENIVKIIKKSMHLEKNKKKVDETKEIIKQQIKLEISQQNDRESDDYYNRRRRSTRRRHSKKRSSTRRHSTRRRSKRRHSTRRRSTRIIPTIRKQKAQNYTSNKKCCLC